MNIFIARQLQKWFVCMQPATNNKHMTTHTHTHTHLNLLTSCDTQTHVGLLILYAAR